MSLYASAGQLLVCLIFISVGFSILWNERKSIVKLARLWKAKLHLRYCVWRYTTERAREEESRSLATKEERQYVERVVTDFVKLENAKQINAILDTVFAEEDAAKRQREAEGAELDMSA